MVDGELESVHSADGSAVRLTITLKHQKKMADRSCTQFYNVLFRRIMNTLKMVQMNKNYYDPTKAMMVPQHKLEIWPGYVTAVHEYEGGVMLCLDVSHKVLRSSTAYDLLQDVYKKDKDNNQRSKISKSPKTSPIPISKPDKQGMLGMRQ